MENATILIVDDSPANLRLFMDSLTKAGFTPLSASSGTRALQELKHIHPDLILLDILMPGLNGFETCLRLKADKATRDIPVIFITALSDTLDKVKGFESGGVDYITKPFHHAELIARIKAHLTIQDIQHQLEKQNRELKQLNESKDKFLSIISHDLRSPFSSLRGLIQFTAQNLHKWTKPKIEEAIVILNNSTENLYALIENLLTWSRIQRGAIAFQPQYLDLQKIIVQSIALFSSIAEQKQIYVNMEITDVCPVYADANMIDAVLRNLLSNAIKFTHPGGRIEVTASQNAQTLTISVRDTGIGLNEKHLAKLFRIDDRYKQLGTQKEKGTGLGLILCKEFIEKNGGTIGVSSTPKKGTTFFFTLPKIIVNHRQGEQESLSRDFTV